MITGERRVLLCKILLILNLSVIWGNSLLSGAESGQMSGGIVAFVMELLRIPVDYQDVLHLVIRKLAHVTEFACLSMLIGWYLAMGETKKCYRMLLPVLLAMAAALVDETIQLYTPDRGPSLTDVWIDTLGAAIGVMLLELVYRVKRIRT